MKQVATKAALEHMLLERARRQDVCENISEIHIVRNAAFDGGSNWWIENVVLEDRNLSNVDLLGIERNLIKEAAALGQLFSLSEEGE